MDITNNEMRLRLYDSMKDDYRNSINLENKILNLGTSLLALGTATGFIKFGETASWFIFALLIPMMLILVKVLFLHQTHKSKCYKRYIFWLEKVIFKLDDSLEGFEEWFDKNVHSFVVNRRGFSFGYITVLTLTPYFFITLGFISHFPCIKAVYITPFILVVIFTICGDFICIKYVVAIKHITKSYY